MSRPALAPASLSPSMFSIVLGTGGISLCSNLLTLRKLALALLAFNAVLLALAWLATALRLALGFRALRADMTDLIRGPSFFFAPLATSIFGIQVAVLTDAHDVIRPLWLFALLLWALLMVVFVVGATIRNDKAAFGDAMSPTWFLPGAALIVTMGFGTHVASEASELMLCGLYGGLLFGLFLNLVVMVALLCRWLFLPVSAEQLHANSWINMGGFAIVAVAGLKLAALHARSVPPGTMGWTDIPLRPIVIFSWIVATWWLPVLLAIGIWRHAYKRVPFRYDTPYWALVFSPSVYAIATAGLVADYHFDALIWVPPLFMVLAGVAWIALILGFAWSLIRR